MDTGKAFPIMGIQGLRGILFCLVFLFHLSWFPSIRTSSYYTFFSGFGTPAVSFFFVISGYVNYLSLIRKKPNTLSFVWKRVRKFYVYYVIAMLFDIILNYDTTDYKIVLSHLFLIQSLIPSAEYYLGLNGVSWFLSALTICYFFMIPIAKRLDKIKRKKVLLTIVLGIQLVLAFLFIHCDKEITRFLLYIHPFSRISDVACGMILASLHKEGFGIWKADKPLYIYLYIAALFFSDKLVPYSFAVSLLPCFGCLLLLDQIVRSKNDVFVHLLHNPFIGGSLQLVLSSLIVMVGCLLLKNFLENNLLKRNVVQKRSGG